MTATHAVSACCSMDVRRSAASRVRGSDATLLIQYNAHHETVTVTLPHVADGEHWIRLLDTAQPQGNVTTHEFDDAYGLAGRALCAFALATAGIATGDLRQGVGSILDVTERPLE